LKVSGEATGRGDVSTLDWKISLGARDISFPGWRELLPEYLSHLDAGSGAFSLTARGRGGALARTDLDFAAKDVVTELSDGPSAKFERISGTLSLIHGADRWTLTGRQMRTVRAGRRDPASQFDATWRAGDTGLLDLKVSASYLRADTLLPLSGLLPQEEIRDRLRAIAPTGEWINTQLAWTRNTVNDPWHFSVSAKFRDVGFAPVGRAPGLRGLSGTIAGNETGGRVTIDSRAAVFNWPAQFAQAVPLETLKTNLYWRRTDDALLIATPDWEMKNRDASAHAKVAWLAPSDGSSPVLTLAAALDNGNVSSAHTYLPRALLAPKVLAWLDRAFVAGRLPHADVVLRGPIKHFPFRDGSGIFLARCAFEGTTLDYGESWPRVENLTAQAEFRNEGMTARMVSGRVANISAASGNARFADFKTGELELHIAAAGDAGDALGFLRATPLDAAAEHAFSGVEAQGPMQSKVDLFLPFKDFVHRRVQVHGHLAGVSLNRPGSTAAASELNGDFDMDGAQVSHADVRGQVLGGPVQVQARPPRSRPAGRTLLEFRGTLTGEGLRAAWALPAGVSFAGQTDWRGALRMDPEPNRERSLRLNSNLTGLEIKLPPPLDKPADTPMAASMDLQWPAGGGAQGRFALDSVLSGSFDLEPDLKGMKLARLALNFGAPESGSGGNAQVVNVGGSVQRLDLAGWLRLRPAEKGAKPLAEYLRAARLQVAELDYLGLAFRGLTLDLAVTPGNLRIAVSGPNVAGTIAVPLAADPSEPWNLQFARLHFDAEAEDESQPGGAAARDANAAADPRVVPALNFRAANVEWGERQIGEVRATLAKLDDGISLTQLTVTGDSFNVTAEGDWRGKDAGVGHIVGTLNSSDVQETIKELGYVPVIEAKTGRMDFDLRWLGAPTGESLAQAAGHLQFALDKGQVVGLKPGAGRVLGLTSVAALRRRLDLDFSDLTDKGLAFDTVRGDFNLRDGNGYTDNLLLKGPAAEIGLIGRVGLKSKDYDQTAVVTGSVGSSLPLAALAGGPMVAGAVLVFTQVFKQELKGLARGYYRITGNWDNPVVERIKGADAAAAAAEVPK
jgi:uncharacterized protein (TIGR02099 family)